MTATRVFLAAQDVDISTGLWVSDGTESGTVEIGGVGGSAVTGAQTNLYPSDIVAFKNGVLFEGNGADDFLGDPIGGLWFSDGTNQGTQEIGGTFFSNEQGIYSYGEDPSELIACGERAFYLGTDSAGNRALWVTDGTAAGTAEIGGLANSGVQNKYFEPIQISDQTAFGNDLLYDGLDAYDDQSLWISDGTAAGTVEIGGLDSAGIKGADKDFDPTDFLVVGKKAFFVARDSKGYETIWSTNGTTKGTQEIGGLKNKGIAHFAAEFDWTGGSLCKCGSGFLFTGHDGIGESGVWWSNGTAAGTVELGGLGGAAFDHGNRFGFYPVDFASVGSGAVFDEGEALWFTNGTTAGTKQFFTGADAHTNDIDLGSSFVVFGNQAAFDALDASGQFTLWMTNGTKKGTRELGGLDNEGVVGAPAGGLDATNFVSAGGDLFFQSDDSKGKFALWVTDGTASGTHEISNVQGASPFGWVPDLVTYAPQ